MYVAGSFAQNSCRYWCPTVDGKIYCCSNEQGPPPTPKKGENSFNSYKNFSTYDFYKILKNSNFLEEYIGIYRLI